MHKNAMSYIEQILEGVSMKQPQYGHLPPISKTIKINSTRQGMRNTAVEATNPLEVFSYEPLHTDVQMLVDQQGLAYNSSQRTKGLEDLAWESGKSVPAAASHTHTHTHTHTHIYIYIYIYIYIFPPLL